MKVYREDDWKAEVEILKDESDEKWDRYTLKVLRTLRESKMYSPVHDGTIFTVDHLKGVAFGGMWSLSEE